MRGFQVFPARERRPSHRHGVAVGDAVRAREHLIEAGIGESLMNSCETGRLDSQVDDDVDIVGRSRVERTSFDLEQEHHLTADDKAMTAESWRQFDEGPPRFLLSAGKRR